MTELAAPMAGTVAALPVAEGAQVGPGQAVVILESMKIEHPVVATHPATVRSLAVVVGDTVGEGQVVAVLDPSPPGAGLSEASDSDPSTAGERRDLADLDGRRSLLADEARPEAVARRHDLGRRTIRENLADLFDEDSFDEWGGFVIAAQRAKKDHDELVRTTPADGLIAGIGTVAGTPCAVLAYDYTVLAGTQGVAGHQKTDRFLEVVRELGLPLVLFAEGGGGRPGDTDVPVVSGNHVRTFASFAALSGVVPTVGIGSGRCFAGNAALLGCCDVIVATEDANIGMGGPAMVEGGGLGTYRPEDIGPISVQTANGVVDVAVTSDVEAVAAVRRYLALATEPTTDGWSCADQAALRDAVPENRKRAYDVRAVVETLLDSGSVFELRSESGPGMVTALGRVEGRAVGVLANDSRHLGGAIDGPAADKAARFLELCDAHGLPVVSLCDTPGFMVGPEAEESAQVRRFGRLFVVAASVTVPMVTVVLRKGYGLGALGMAAGSFHAPQLIVAWPTGEFGGMNIEGAVRLGARRELEAIEDDDEREAVFEAMVASVYRRSRALDSAEVGEIDDVIDPADSRRRIVGVLRASDAGPGANTGRPAAPRRPLISPW